MNHIHRKIWSVRLGAYIAVAETARGRGKRSGSAIVGAVMALAAAASPAFGGDLAPGVLPSGGTVSAGAAAIGQQGNAMTVHQQSQRAAINWQKFSVGSDASVAFVQPNAQAVILNRVTGNERSVIDGALRANGQVFLLNPNGVLFSASSRVDTAGLVASTRGLSNADFMAGRTTFSGSGSGDVVNQGQLRSADGGYVALIGRQVRNDGVISASLGTVALASGDKVSLNFDGSALVGVTVDEAALAALVQNGGAIMADGGTVLLKATAAEALLDTVVNNSGEIRARTLGERNGKIVLLGEGGKVEIGGKLDVSAPDGGNGGYIDTSGPVVSVAPTAAVAMAAPQGRAGTWLIDPTDFEISAGTVAQSASGIGAATLQDALGAGNVVIQTQSSGDAAGNINVNAAVAWSANQLTLEAHGDINVNAVMSATGTSTLDLKTGYNFDTASPAFDVAKTVRTRFEVDESGAPAFTGRIDFDRTGSGLLTINNAAYTLINALGAAGSATGTDLQGINGNLAGKYALASNIDASATTGWGNWGSGTGFNPIGRSAGLTGVLDGLGHTIDGYQLSASANNLGLIGRLNGADAAVRNIGVTNINVGGDAPPNFGGLVGLISAGSVNNAFATGTMNSYAPQSGGLVGLADAGSSISQSYANVTISNGADDAGGLVGRAGTGAVIADSSAAGNLAAPYGNNTGGLIGAINGATVSGSTASGSVSGTNNVGGLVGLSEGVSSVIASSASGNVTGANSIGGLVGSISASGGTASVVAQSSATGNVTASNAGAGGLIGLANGGGASVPVEITDSFASTGTVTAPGLGGGLIGDANVINVTGAYATGDVVSSLAGAFWYGGLMGRARNMNLQRSYATGNVDVDIGVTRYVGGLIGETINGNFSDIYARGNVNAAGGRWVGGLIGFNSATISNAYATGQVVGSLNLGGLIGAAAGGSVSNSFWDVETSGLGTAGATTGSAGGTGLSTADMTTTATFTNAGWDFTSGSGVWARRDDLNDRYPVLRNFGYVERFGTVLIDPAWLASSDSSAVSYTTSGLLSGDTLTLTQTGSQLSYSFSDPSRLGYYDGLVVAARAPAGDLTINRPLGWSDFKLNLEAAGNLNVNAVLSVTGTAQVDMKAGYNFNAASPTYASGYRVNMGMDAAHAFTGRVDIDRSGTGILAINGAGYTLINQLGAAGDEQSPNGTLQGMDVFTNYALASSIDASATATWNSGAGFVPIADNYYPYVARFNGLGHTVTGLTINQPAPRQIALYQVGMFGLADNADFSNLALADVSMVGPDEVGGLLGATINNPSTIANVTVSGTIEATNASGGTGGSVGGIVGRINNAATALANVHSVATVLGAGNNIGGLAGYADHATLTASSNTGTVTGADNVGGLIGQSVGSSIADADNSAAVQGGSAVGGLVGLGNTGSAVTGSHASGTVSGAGGVGGLIGILDSQSGANSVATSYATGNVTGTQNVGGLLGDSPFGGTVIERSYASGTVFGQSFLGGFIGTGNATITDAYATGDVTASGSGYTAAGGFAGGGAGTMVLDRVYSSGVVSAPDLNSAYGSGGLSGFGFYTVTNSFYDVSKNPNAGAIGLGVGKTTAEMKDISTYTTAGWNFDIGGVWGRKDTLNNGYPVLRAFGFTDAIVVDLGVTSRQYGDANPLLSNLTITGCGVPNCAGLITSVTWGNTLNAATHAGNYALADPGVLDFSFGGGTTAASFDISYATPTFSITPRALTLAANSGASQVYNGSADASAALFTASNLVNGDSVTLAGAAQLSSPHVGSQSVAGIGSLSVSNTDYQLSGLPGGTVAITPRTATLAVAPGATRAYDGTADASSALFAVTNLIGSDTAALSGTALLDGAHAGAHAVASVGSLGLDNSDYVLASTLPSGTVAITPRELALSAVAGASRAYDGTAEAGASLFSVGGVLGADSVTLAGSALLDSTHAGTRTVAGAGSLALDNGDYALGALPAGTISITPRLLAASTLPDASRVYDGTSSAASSLFSLSGVLSGDSAALTGAATLDSTHAGTRNVADAGSLALDNGDYALGGTPTGTISITPRPLLASALPDASRVYDGTASAASSLFSLSGILSGDSAALTGAATLDSTHAGTRTVADAGSLALDNGDYALGATPTGTIGVTPRPLLASALPDATRVYDGTASAAGSLFSLSGVLSGNSAALTGAATLDSTHAGTRNVADVGSLALNNGDYALGALPNGTISVTPRLLVASTSPDASRVYDGTTGAAGSLFSLGGLLSGDSAALTGTATLDSAHAGTRNVADAGTLALDNGDYALGAPPTGTISITPRPLVASALPDASRVYDGSTSAESSLFSLAGVLDGDSAALTGTATLDSTHAGTRSVAGAGSLALDNGDYALGALPNGTISVTPRPLVASALPNASREYDGSTGAAGGLFNLSGVLSGDSAALTGAATLDSNHAGTRTVTGAGTLALSNGDYALDGVPGGSVSVTPRTVTVTAASGAARSYDGSASADASLFALSNVVSGDSLALTGSGTLDSAHAGTRSITAAGTLALNNSDYRIGSAQIGGSILVNPLAIDLALNGAATRVFDGTANADASLFTVSGLLAGDQASLSGNALLNGATVGSHVLTGLGALALSNADYTLPGQVPSGTVTISPAEAELAVEGSALDSVISSATRTAALPVADAARTLLDTGSTLAVMPANVVDRSGGLAAAFAQGEPLAVLSAPAGDEPSEGVTMTQARRMLGSNAAGAGEGGTEVRVPVSRNSLAEIVNGGVKLPSGVDQVLFVVKASK
jgi:filamentous hemagglutinin family protein